MAFLPRTPMHPLRTAGKVLMFSGVFLVGMAVVGAWKPYTDLRNALYVRAKVIRNDLAFKTANGYAFHLGLTWLGAEGEERSQITSFVQAPNEEQAHRKYRGKNLETGKEYEFPLDPRDPTRVLPFTGYTWRTFGPFAVMAIGGLFAFGMGMFFTKKGQALQQKPNI